MDLQSVERVWQPQLLKHNNSSLPENIRMSLYMLFSRFPLSRAANCEGHGVSNIITNIILSLSLQGSVAELWVNAFG